jgi:hypothetical protein
MIVSQFTVAHDPSSGVSKFYRLLLTNLADNEYSFRITVHSPYKWVDQKVAYQIGEWYKLGRNDLSAIGQHRYRARLIHLEPRETEAFILGPKGGEWDPYVGGYVGQDWTFVRGYVELTVPETYTKMEEGTKAGYFYEVEVTQGTDPVPVLLHPSEVNGKWDGWGDGQGTYTDAAAITLSTGKAENVITPGKDPTWEISLILEAFTGRWNEAEEGDKDGLRRDIEAFVEQPESLMAVIAYLGRTGASTDNVEALNTLLSEAGLGIRLTTMSSDQRRPPSKG